MAEQATIPCPICAEALRVSVTTNRNGKHAISLHCPKDGRHIRAFINHRPFVEEALTRMTAAEEARQATGDGARAEEALQNAPKRIADPSVTNERGSER